MENDVKAIKMGSKIIVFINGKRQVVSKKVSPETFELIEKYIEQKDIQKIANLFNDFEDKIADYLKGIVEIKGGKAYSIVEKNQPYIFSRLLLRKAIELMALNESPDSIRLLGDKLNYIDSTDVSEKINDLFARIKIIEMTKLGNIILPVYSSNKNNDFENTEKVQGKPIMVNEHSNRVGRGNNYGLKAHINDFIPTEMINDEEVPMKIAKVIISPFDIVSCSSDTLFVTRYKVLDENVAIKEISNGISTIENEELFEISYNIFKEFSKDKYKAVTV